MATQENELQGQMPQHQIDLFKKQHKDIFQVTCDGKVCYLRKPDRKTLSAASALGKNDPMKFNEVILENCFIGGCEDFKTDDGLFLAVSGVLDQVIEIKEAELKKL